MPDLHHQLPLRVPPLKVTSSLNDLMIEEEHFAFAEKDKNGNLQYFHGLKNFLLLPPFVKGGRPDLDLSDGDFVGVGRILSGKRTNPVYIFDNHHHALSFRYQAYLHSKKICTLLHIDQHSDMQDNQFSLPDDLLVVDRSYEVSQFVQECCTVGNFIQPALKSWLISRVQPLITTYALQHVEIPREPYILDIDLDFRAPETGNAIESHLALLQTLIQKAEAVTIATSPYFLDQDLAIAMVKKIFS